MISTESTRGVFESTKGDRFIGRNKEGDRIYISVELRHKHAKPGSSFETTDHEFISEYVELGMTGLVVPKYCRTAYGAGQIVDELGNMKGWATNGISFKRIREFWERCHLNGMNPDCMHQSRVKLNQNPYYKRDALEQTLRCPWGYKYGSKWLVKPLSDEDMAFAKELIAALRENEMYVGN